jgi:NAD+ synthase (glutamine-hydrolysing)
MKIALAQLNYTIGDFEGNKAKIIHSIKTSARNGAEVVFFSELAVCGAPPLDLLKDEFFTEKSIKTLKEIATYCTDIAAIMTIPLLKQQRLANIDYPGCILFDGQIEHIHKAQIYDSYIGSYRASKDRVGNIHFNDSHFLLTISDDIYKNYHTGYASVYNALKQSPDFLITITASPFSHDILQKKKKFICNKAEDFCIPIIYLNQVGANSEYIFDGGSMIINEDGEIIKQMKYFEEQLLIFDTQDFKSKKVYNNNENVIKLIHDALVLGIRDYFKKSGFKKAVIGLSGGLDSAVVATLAVSALGKKNVHALLLPSKYSSDHSITDAVALAKNLGITYDIIPIKDTFDSIENTLAPIFEGVQPDVTEENIQARIRAILLMAYSNKFGHLVLNTSNKSEGAMGYGTLYGDLCGSLSVIGDVYKTDVYKIANYINSEKEIIPVNTIQKAPSAELHPDQKDTDSLPEYKILDEILFCYIEELQSTEEIIAQGYDETIVKRIVSMFQKSEYKRFQFPPILKVSSKSLGERRMPLINKYTN